MNNLKEYIIEKLHIDKNINVKNNYEDIEYVLTVPVSSEFPEEYLLCKDDETTGNNNFYVLSFNDIKKICSSDEFKSSFYAYKFNKDYIEYIDDIKDGKKSVKRKDILVSGTGDTLHNIIKKHK